MPQDLHIRVSDADAKSIQRLVEKGVFETQSEAVRFGIKRLIHTGSFESAVVPKLTAKQKLALRANMGEHGITITARPRPGLAKSVGEANLTDLRAALVIAEVKIQGEFEQAKYIIERASEVLLKEHGLPPAPQPAQRPGPAKRAVALGPVEPWEDRE